MTGRITSVKNPSDSIGNGTRDHPACSAVPQPSAPSCALQQSKSLKGKKMIRDGWMVGIKKAKEQEKLEETG